MIERCSDLSAAVLDEVAALERRVIATDGGRLKLEWNTLRSRPDGVVSDVVARVDGRLVGFVGIYTFGPDAELTGMVDPDVRRQGIGSALLDAGLGLCRERGLTRVLLVVPRRSEGGRALAGGPRATLDHSEFALHQRDPVPDRADDPDLLLRPATAADVEDIARLIEAGFGHPAGDVSTRLGGTTVIERAGRVVATLAVEHHDDRAGIYGFVVEPALQGQGLGREILRRACRTARRDGARELHLEVEVDNDRALGLYRSLGFEPGTTEDYYALGTAGPAGSAGSPG